MGCAFRGMQEQATGGLGEKGQEAVKLPPGDPPGGFGSAATRPRSGTVASRSPVARVGRSGRPAAEPVVAQLGGGLAAG